MLSDTLNNNRLRLKASVFVIMFFRIFVFSGLMEKK